MSLSPMHVVDVLFLNQTFNVPMGKRNLGSVQAFFKKSQLSSCLSLIESTNHLILIILTAKQLIALRNLWKSSKTRLPFYQNRVGFLILEENLTIRMQKKIYSLEMSFFIKESLSFPYTANYFLQKIENTIKSLYTLLHHLMYQKQ